MTYAVLLTEVFTPKYGSKMPGTALLGGTYPINCRKVHATAQVDRQLKAAIARTLQGRHSHDLKVIVVLKRPLNGATPGKNCQPDLSAASQT